MFKYLTFNAAQEWTSIMINTTRSIIVFCLMVLRVPFIGCGGHVYVPHIVVDLDGDGQLEIFVQSFDHGMDVFTVPGSGCNCKPWTTGRGGPLRMGQPNRNDL
jgi:hypothetical protein